MKFRFDNWMEKCLFDPERGYYSRQVKNIGVDGDFTTTPELSGALGKAISAWIIKEWERHEKKLPIIEMGAGSGALSQGVRNELGWKKRIGLKHAIIEVSEGLREKQREKLEGKVHWFSTTFEALKHFNGEALIFSNEFVDAFPVRIFQKECTGWHELFLDIVEGAVTEQWEACTALPESSVFTENYEDGQRVEIHASYNKYLKEELSSLRKGSILTSDYGETLNDLYYRRLKGTIRAYFMQERLEGALIYQNMGRQDITADVNFTDLERWGAEMEWENAPIKNQAEFLKPFLPPNDLLLNPLGAGTAFKVLIQRTQT